MLYELRKCDLSIDDPHEWPFVYRAMGIRAINAFADIKGYRWKPCKRQLMRGYFVNSNGDCLFVFPIGA